jgi:hypothetical protein
MIGGSSRQRIFFDPSEGNEQPDSEAHYKGESETNHEFTPSITKDSFLVMLRVMRVVRLYFLLSATR